MSLDIVIERPAARGPQESDQLALVRLPGVFLSENANYQEPEEGEKKPRRAREYGADGWFITNRLDYILEESNPIFVDDVKDAEAKLRELYGSVINTYASNYTWDTCAKRERFSSDGSGFFVCVEGEDSSKGPLALAQAAKEAGKVSVFSSHADAGYLCSTLDYEKVGAIPGVYTKAEGVNIRVKGLSKEESWYNLGYLYRIEYHYDPKREKRTASARKSAEKRRLSATPNVSLAQQLISALVNLARVGDVEIKMDSTRLACRQIQKSDTEHLLVKVIEIQTKLGYPYRDRLLFSRWDLERVPSIMQSVLKHEAAMLASPVLASVVPWIKAELEWFGGHFEKETSEEAVQQEQHDLEEQVSAPLETPVA